ncbi:MAG TPA: acyl-CoA dehydrogenase family protein [Solirubrobacteraceae bacterium]
MTPTSPLITPERARLIAEAREFTRAEVAPIAGELDSAKQDVPDELMAKLAERGYFGILIPKQYGGMGLGVFEYAIISEELAKSWMSVASVLARAQGMGTAVADLDRRDELLRRAAAGQWIAGAALSEADAGSDLAAVSTAAVREGDHYVINGDKRWCGMAKVADFILLLARTGEDRHKGLDTFILPKARGTFPKGVTGEELPKIGYHGITSWSLHLENVHVPAENLLVQADHTGTGFYDTVRMLNRARVHTAARAVGAAQGALDEATEYAKSRVQFGRPIAEFQAIQFKLADMVTAIEAARQLYYYAAELHDAGERCEKECSMAKLFASEMAERVTSEAMQILGGNGYTTLYSTERHWRDARLTKIFEGTSEIQRLIISKRHLAEVP